MKWIGQHIYDLVSRFRSDIYLEDISTGTIASGGYLGLDSNNKIVKSAETGDITGISFGTDTLGLVVASGDVDWTIAGGNAINTAGSGGNTITINHDDTSSQASVNNSGRTYIQDITLDTYGHVTALTSATETVTNTDTNTRYDLSAEDGSDTDREIIRLTGDDDTADEVVLIAGTGLGIARSSNKITFTNTVTDTNTQLSNAEVRTAVEAATDSNVFTDADHTKLNDIAASANNYSLPSANETTVGGVELATIDEANTGTDTARAVTPTGLKYHVDNRFTYQYITFIGNADIGTNWATPGTNGPFTHSYNTDTGVSGTSVGSTTHSFARSKQQGFVVPYDSSVLVGFYGMIRNNTENNQGALGLFHSTYATFGAKTTTSTFTLQAYAAADQTGAAGSSYKGQTKAVDLSRSLDLTAGDIIIPAIMQASEKAYAQFTIVIKTPII